MIGERIKQLARRLDSGDIFGYNKVEMELLRRLFGRNGDLNKLMTLRELSEKSGVLYITLYVAAREGRLRAFQSGHIWLSSLKDLEDARRNGKIRR